MRRVAFDKEIKASSIEKAAEIFSEELRKKGYDWAAEEMTESISNGYVCFSNASEHNLKMKEVNSPKSSDWTYYWAIEENEDKKFYARFIERQ